MASRGMKLGGSSWTRVLLIVCSALVVCLLLGSVATGSDDTEKEFYLRGSMVTQDVGEETLRVSSVRQLEEEATDVFLTGQEFVQHDYGQPCANNAHDPTVCKHG